MANLAVAVDLERGVEARQRLSDQLELVGGADRRFLVELDLSSIRRDRAVIEAAAGRLVHDLAVGRLAFGFRHVPALRRRRNQPHTRAGAGLQQHSPRRAHAAAAGGDHVAIDHVFAQVTRGRGVFDPHLRPVAFQLFGDDHRQRGDGALPHLVVRRAEQNAAVRIDDKKGVDLRSASQSPGRRAARPMLAASASRGNATAMTRPPAAEVEATTNWRRVRDVIWFMVASPLTSSSGPRRDGWRGGRGHKCRSGRYWKDWRRCRRRSAADVP